MSRSDPVLAQGAKDGWNRLSWRPATDPTGPRHRALSARFGGACVARLTPPTRCAICWNGVGREGIRRADAQGKRCKLGTDGLCFVLVLVQSRQMHR